MAMIDYQNVQRATNEALSGLESLIGRGQPEQHKGSTQLTDGRVGIIDTQGEAHRTREQEILQRLHETQISLYEQLLSGRLE